MNCGGYHLPCSFCQFINQGKQVYLIIWYLCVAGQGSKNDGESRTTLHLVFPSQLKKKMSPDYQVRINANPSKDLYNIEPTLKSMSCIQHQMMLIDFQTSEHRHSIWPCLVIFHKSCYYGPLQCDLLSWCKNCPKYRRHIFLVMTGGVMTKNMCLLYFGQFLHQLNRSHCKQIGHKINSTTHSHHLIVNTWRGFKSSK